MPWCAPDDSDVYRDEVRRLKVDLEAARTRHAQELKAKNDYVRGWGGRGGEGWGRWLTLLLPVLR